MVLVRTETGQLVMVPQQVLAQAQAKTQQAQTTVANISSRPVTPTAGAAIRVSAAGAVCTEENPIGGRGNSVLIVLRILRVTQIWSYFF